MTHSGTELFDAEIFKSVSQVSYASEFQELFWHPRSASLCRPVLNSRAWFVSETVPNEAVFLLLPGFYQHNMPTEASCSLNCLCGEPASIFSNVCPITVARGVSGEKYCAQLCEHNIFCL
jgi:hypothetical protein